MAEPAVLFEGFIENDKDLTRRVPTGYKPPEGYVLGTGKGQYYAHVRAFENGQVVVQWFQRGSGTPGQKDDPVVNEQTLTNPTLAAEWKEKEEKPSSATIREINGVPHERGADGIWRPAQTAQGAATAGTTQRPAGGRKQVEGTPDPTAPGGFNNEQPRNVWRNADGQEIWAEPLSPAEMDAWRENRERSRNPGQKTDTEIQAGQPKPGARPHEEADPANPARLRRWNPQANGGQGAWEDAGANVAGQPKPGIERVVGSDGKTYVVTTTVTPDGKVKIETVDAAGNPVPGGVPTAPPTATERKPVTGHPGTYAVTTKDARTNTTESYFENEAGQRVPPPVAPGKPFTYPGPNGVTMMHPTDAQTGMPTGTPVVLQGSGETPKPVKAPDGTWGYWKDDGTGRPVWTPTEGPKESVPPDTVTGFRPDATKEDWGIADFNEMVWAEVRAGRLTKPDGAALVQGALGQAAAAESTRQSRVAAGTNVRSQDVNQRQQDISASNQRYSSSAGMFNPTVGSVLPFANKAGDQGHLIAGALQELLQMGSQMAAANAGPIPGRIGYPSVLGPYAPTIPPVGDAGYFPGGVPAPALAPSPTVQVAPPPEIDVNAGAMPAGGIVPTEPPALLRPPAVELDADGSPRVFTPASATTPGAAPLTGTPPASPLLGNVPASPLLTRRRYDPTPTSLELLRQGFDPDVVSELQARWLQS